MEQARDLWAAAFDETVKFGLRHLVWLLLFLASGLFFGRRYWAMRADIETLKQRPPSINITNNIVSGQTKRARLSGQLHLGAMYYPGLVENVDYVTVLVPEIYIEHENGQHERLAIDGLEMQDKDAGVIQMVGGLRVALGPPPQGESRG